MTTKALKKPDKKKRILVVDDHPIVRNGLAMLINEEPDLEVCGEAASAAQANEAADRLLPDLVILDISIEGANGIEVTKVLHRRYAELPILILSMHEEDVYAERALRAGARGYLTKHEPPEMVIKAIRKILQGELHVSEKISSKLLQEIMEGPVGERRIGVDRLTDRELEVFELIGQGQSMAEIAQQLHLSVKTVESHRANIRQKLSLRSALELAHRAIRWVENESGA
jgi:DNA-binding NarL/FixJ family response regulator